MKTKNNIRSKVMKSAWRIYRSTEIKWSDALRKAWALVKAIKEAVTKGHDMFTMYFYVSMVLGISRKEAIGAVHSYYYK